MQTKTRPKILVVDDESNLVFGLEAILTREGFEVETACNGSEGMQTAVQFEPELIICDIMMPKMNGFEFKKNLAQHAKLASLPFIFLTARTARVDKIAGFNNGCDDYITKPFDVEELVARVRALFKRQESSRLQSQIQVEELRKSISSVVTHELRTPLGIVLNTLELALREKFDHQSDDLQWYLKTALSSTHKLRSLVNDLLFLHNSDHGQINTFRQSVDIDINLLSALQPLAVQWQKKNVTLESRVDPEVVIHAPREPLAQAFGHLVDNAFKFSPSNSLILISIKKNGRGGCIIQIYDEGPGIPPELREQVFERYYQASSGDTRNFGGLGVGLSIARLFARTMGGDVNILDSDQGCTVQMTIPPAPMEARPGD